MKAALINAYGGPEVIEIRDVAPPTVGPGHVLIRSAAGSFNPADAAIRAGALKTVLPVAFPYVLGVDTAGVVEAVGEGVGNFAVGDRVFAFVNFVKQGSLSELVVVDATEVARAPSSIALADAAVLPGVGCTAWQGLFVHGDLQPGQRVLILGASGGVGSIAVQLAKWRGAHVVAEASRRNASLLSKLGAHQVLAYDDEATNSAPIDPVDLIFNASAASAEELTSRMSLIHRGGVMVSAANRPDQAVAEKLGIRTLRMASKRSAAHLTEIAKLVDEGHLKPIISARRKLDELRDVHSNSVPFGKICIVVNEGIK